MLNRTEGSGSGLQVKSENMFSSETRLKLFNSLPYVRACVRQVRSRICYVRAISCILLTMRYCLYQPLLRQPCSQINDILDILSYGALSWILTEVVLDRIFLFFVLKIKN